MPRACREKVNAVWCEYRHNIDRVVYATEWANDEGVDFDFEGTHPHEPDASEVRKLLPNMTDETQRLTLTWPQILALEEVIQRLRKLANK